MASERNIVLKIKAEYGSFKADMAQVASAAENAAKKTEQSGTRASSAMGRLAQDAQKNRQSWETAGTAITAFGAVAVAGVGLAIAKYAQFEQAMSRVQAATHESSTNMGQLREAAITAGADTAYSAEEAAGAIEELAKAGVSTKDILAGGLTGALSLAAAGELDVAEAAETAASAMVQFKLKGEDIPHIADLLAAGAGKAQGSVRDLGQALGQAGLVAAATGLDLEETVGGLAAFASAGLVGSDAGTSFKTMLQRLNPQSEAASVKMAELGISAYDSEGKFIGLEAVAGKLKTGMSGLSEEARASAMNVIFGSDAVRAANVLYEQGAEGIAAWTDAVDTAGYAAVTASINQDNLIGDLEKLGGAFDTVFIKGGSGASGALRGLVQSAEDVVDAVGRIPEPILNTGFAIAGIVGGTGLLIGGLLKLAPAAIETVTSFRNLGTEGGKIPGTLGKIAKGAGIAAIAIAGLQILGTVFTNEKSKSTEEYASAILEVANAGKELGASGFDKIFDDFGTSFGTEIAKDINGVNDAVERLTNRKWDDGINNLGDTLFSWTGAAKSDLAQVEEEMSGLGEALGDLVSNGGAEAAAESFNKLTKIFEENGQGAAEALSYMPGYEAALRELGNAAGVSLNDTELLELATGKIPAVMQEAQAATALAEAQYGTYTDAAGQATPITEDMAKALEEVGLSADGTIVSLEKFVGLLQESGLLTLSARDASRGFQESIDAIAPGIDDLIEKYGSLGGALNDTATDFNELTPVGRDAATMFDGVASAGASYTQALADAGGSQEELTGSMQGTYDALLTAANQLGITGGAAEALAQKVMGIPPGVSIETYFSDQAILKAAETTGSVDAIPRDVQIRSSMSSAAMETAGATKQSADDVPDQVTIDSWMSDAGFVEALRTRAAALNIPEKEVIDSFMSSAGRNEADSTTASVLGIPPGASVSAFMESFIRDMADSSRASLDSIDGRRVSTYADHYETTHKAIIVTEKNQFVRNGQVGIRAHGGRIPRNATGGRLPTSGPGTERQDGILGVSTLTGEPTSWVDKGEWVINGRSSEKYNALLGAINRDDPRLRAMGLYGLAAGGRVDGLTARPGEANSSWEARQLRIVLAMQDTVGELADWQIHEDGSGWIRTMDGAMLQIADGAYTVTEAAGSTSNQLGLATEDAHWAAETARAAAGSFQGAGASANAAGGFFAGAGATAMSASGSFQVAGGSANATAGTFQFAGRVTQQAANAIVAATAAVNAAGRQRKPAQAGGLVARAGEQNVVWQGRQDQFEQAISQKYGGLKYSNIHEDGSGQMVLDDGRKIELDGGRWKFVSKFRYGAPLVNGVRQRKLSKYAAGGRLPTSGPGTEETDGFMGVSSMTGMPSFYADGGEWIINGRSSQKHHSLLTDVNRDAPWLADLARYANGGRSMAHGYAPVSVGRDPGRVPQAAAAPMSMVGTLTMDGGQVLGTFRGIARSEARNEIAQQGEHMRGRRNG